MIEFIVSIFLFGSSKVSNSQDTAENSTLLQESLSDVDRGNLQYA